jgi:hypothetical protein
MNWLSGWQINLLPFFRNAAGEFPATNPDLIIANAIAKLDRENGLHYAG